MISLHHYHGRTFNAIGIYRRDRGDGLATSAGALDCFADILAKAPRHHDAR